ncbi:MAG TPA: 2-phospho-L-lactate transferase [Candidatus Acidoferrales bacterium]|nr:2-phospho-L-lactate transferase [Candidatus Acidoferrales bacterium]
MRIAALAGGVGASKLLLGLARVMDPRQLTVIVNTGDDLALHGLEISPDLDIVTYTLGGVVSPATGWGFDKDTFVLLERLSVFGCPKWFQLGDRDLATHVYRTDELRKGATLAQVADSIRRALGVKARILPMSNQPVRTMIGTRKGFLHFQEYLVKLRARPAVRRIRFEGSREAEPAPGVLEALRTADGIVICPSNPLISIGPILAVPGIREALRKRRDCVIAVCPLVGGKSLKGPSDRMMMQMGLGTSVSAIAKLYQDICGTLLIDRADSAQVRAVEALGVRAICGPTVMRTIHDKARVARLVLDSISNHAAHSRSQVRGRSSLIRSTRRRK